MIKSKEIKEVSKIIDQAFLDLGVLLTRNAGTVASAQTAKKIKYDDAEKKFLNKITKAMR